MGTIAFKELRRLWQRHESGEEEPLCDSGTEPALAEADERIALLQERVRALIEELESWPEAIGCNDFPTPSGASEPAESAGSTSRPDELGCFGAIEKVSPADLSSLLYRTPPTPAGPHGPGISLTIQISRTPPLPRTGALVPYRGAALPPAPLGGTPSLPDLAENWARHRRRMRAWLASVTDKQRQIRREPAPDNQDSAASLRGSAPPAPVSEAATDTTSAPSNQIGNDAESQPVAAMSNTTGGAMETARAPAALRDLEAKIHPALANLLAGLGVLLALAALLALLQELLYWY